MKLKISEIKNPEPRRNHGDIKSLAENIKKEGLLQPIVVNQNNELICGRRRFEAILKLGWTEVPVYKIETENEIDILSKAIAENIMRLNLTWQEEVKAKEELDQLMREKYGESKTGGDRQSEEAKKHSSNSEKWSQDKTSKLLNQSFGLISEDLQLAKALNQYPELEKVKNKSMAKRKLKSLKRKERKSIIPNIPDNSDKYKLIHGDITEVSNKIKNNSIDWIITDPPYPKEFLPLIEKLGVFANQKLKNNGSLLCLIGQSYLPEIYEILSKYLIYNWTCCYLMPGDAVTIWPRKATSGWKPVLWFLKKEHRKDTIYDVFKSEKKEKEHHYWGQSESGFEDIIYNFTDPGDIICDPFLGGGTTGVISIKLNRFFIGIDNDIKAIETTKERISELLNGKA